MNKYVNALRKALKEDDGNPSTTWLYQEVIDDVELEDSPEVTEYADEVYYTISNAWEKIKEAGVKLKEKNIWNETSEAFEDEIHKDLSKIFTTIRHFNNAYSQEEWYADKRREVRKDMNNAANRDYPQYKQKLDPDVNASLMFDLDNES